MPAGWRCTWMSWVWREVLVKGETTYHCPECGERAHQWRFDLPSMTGNGRDLYFHRGTTEMYEWDEWETYIDDCEDWRSLTKEEARQKIEWGEGEPQMYDGGEPEEPENGKDSLLKVTSIFRFRLNSPIRDSPPWYSIPIHLDDFDYEELSSLLDDDDEWYMSDSEVEENYTYDLKERNEDPLYSEIEEVVGHEMALNIIYMADLDSVGIPDRTPNDKHNLFCMNDDCRVTIPLSKDMGDDRSVYFVPNRTRAQTIEGFSKSREMTAMIESTFGMVMADMTPESILSMGGDEMIARVVGESFYEIVESVENHSLKFHTDVIRGDEEPRLLWWAMLCKEDEIGDLTKTGFKDTLRGFEDWGPRFVNPMWPDFNAERTPECLFIARTVLGPIW